MSDQAPQTLPLHLRRAEPSDAGALALVGAATFLESYAHMIPGADIVRHASVQHGADYYQRHLGADALPIWVLTTPTGALVGYVQLTDPALPVADPAPDDIEIKRIYLLSAFQGHGHGAALMAAALEGAKALGRRRVLLGTYKGNSKAIRFYEKCGFEILGERDFQVGESLFSDYVLGRPL
ncbi:MAG: GNAT family N-acetyltransferase [Asticcacaulis sp.]